MTNIREREEKSYISEYEVKWTLIISLLMLFWLTVSKLIGIHNAFIIHYELLFYAPIFLLILGISFYLALKDKKDNYYNKRMTWKRCFYSGVVLSVFIAIISPFIQYIVNIYIVPDFFEDTHTLLTEGHHMTLEEAQEYFNLDTFQIKSAVGNLLFGILISFLLSFHLKKRSRSKRRKRKSH